MAERRVRVREHEGGVMIRRAFLVILLAVSACGGGDDDDAAAGPDAIFPGGPDAGLDGAVLPPVATWERCESVGQCPADHVCAAPVAGVATICTKSCTTSAECPASPAGAASPFCPEGLCAIYCAQGGFIPPCPTGMECRYFPGFADGACGFPAP